MKTQFESADALLAAIARAREEQDFNIAADISLLRDQYTKLSKRDYRLLLARLHEKYTQTEQATVRAALLARCKAGDAAAIKLYYALRAAPDGEGEGVQIVDDIR